jgi:hypothetical protein
VNVLTLIRHLLRATPWHSLVVIVDHDGGEYDIAEVIFPVGDGPLQIAITRSPWPKPRRLHSVRSDQHPPAS